MNTRAYSIGQFIRNVSLKAAEVTKSVATTAAVQTKDVTKSFVAGVQGK